MTLFAEVEPVPCRLCGGTDATHLADNCGLSVVRCRGCGLVYVQPQPTAEALQAHYSRAELFTEEPRRSWFDVPAEVRRLHWDRRLRVLRRVAPFPNGRPGRLLDVGCGMGDFLSAAAAAGWVVAGFEASLPSAAFAREQFGLRDILTAPSLESAALPEAAFDAATLIHVLEHTRDPVATLRAVRRALRPGGVVVAEVPNVAYVYAPSYTEPLSQQVHLFHFDRRTLAAAFRAAGFARVRVELCGVGYPDPDRRRRTAAEVKSEVKRLLFRLCGVSFERGLRAVGLREPA